MKVKDYKELMSYLKDKGIDKETMSYLKELKAPPKEGPKAKGIDHLMIKNRKDSTIPGVSFPTVHVIQEIPGTKEGKPKYIILGASEYGVLNFLLDERSQMIFSPGPLVFKLRQLLKDFKTTDYLLLTGDPAIIGVACSIVSDITNGHYNLLKWDKQERKYYPIEINLYEKGI